MSVIIDGSAGVTTNAGGSVNPSTNVEGINFSCRAFVNFDGTRDTTGATSTANTNRLIRASGNVTSVLRNSAGDYTVNFTTAMPDANYAYNCSGTPQNSATDQCRPYGSTATAQSTTVARFIYVGNSGVIDPLIAVISFFR